MRQMTEQMCRPVNGKPTSSETLGVTGAVSARKGIMQPLQRTRDKASPAAAVMLHLRSCYVSKAAILTIPGPSVPVENRSPA
jgi:hypothetical protein